MSDLYPDNKGHRPYPCEHISLCVDPAYHDQYHYHQYGDTHTDMPSGDGKCGCCCSKDNTDNSGNTDISTEYNGLPRYDHPHPHPCSGHCYHKRYIRPLLRDEEVGNIIRVESRIIESLLVKLYSCVEDKDVFVKMELGSKYSIKWIGPDGVNECTGILTDFKASQHSTIYQPFNADGYYIIMDCSKEGESIVKKILISMIRDIVPIDSTESAETTIEHLVQDLESQQQLIENLKEKIKKLKLENNSSTDSNDENKDTETKDDQSKDNTKEDPSSPSTSGGEGDKDTTENTGSTTDPKTDSNEEQTKSDI